MASDKISIMMDMVAATVISCIMENEGLSADKAMRAFYHSEVFDRLCDVETGLYQESGAYVHDLYQIKRENMAIRRSLKYNFSGMDTLPLSPNHITIRHEQKYSID